MQLHSHPDRADVERGGTYSVAGSTFLTTPLNGRTRSNDYCVVQGTTLHVLSVPTTLNLGAMGPGTITTDVVAQKQ